MNASVPIAMFGWPLVVIFLFTKLPKHKAVIVALIVAWLFLPVVHDPVLGFRLTKMRATCWPVLIAALLLDFNRVSTFRPRWVDAPIIAWCLSPSFSSLSNDLGIYDAFSQGLDQFVTWGIPYFIGRLYLTNLDQLRDLGAGLIYSGLVYTPLCLIEIRVSPQLHTWVYGYFPHESFAQSMRYGGYRPTVFMEHGLAVGAWMCTVTLAAFWCWRSKAVTKFRMGVWMLPGVAVAIALFVILVLSKSIGALGLCVVGSAALWFCFRSQSKVLVFVLLLIPAFYVYGRAWGGWTGKGIADAVSTYIDHERAESFEFRLENENVLIGKAMERPLFGWGGWGRARVYDSEGVDITTADGLWIIVFGNNGAYGLLTVGLAIGLPAALVFWGIPSRQWVSPVFAFPVVLAMSLVLYFIDDIANAMVNPVFMLAAGGLNSLAAVPGWRKLAASVKHAPFRAVGHRMATEVSAPRPTMVRAQAKFGPAPTTLSHTSELNESGVDRTCPVP